MKLQGRYAGFSTGDCIVFVRNPQDGREAKLCLQMKEELAFSASDEELEGALQAAWADFTDHDLLSPDLDRIALVTGPLSQMNISHVRPLFEMARGCADADEFFEKAATERFIGKLARGKLKTIRSHIDEGLTVPISDDAFWQFLKVFHLIGYDFDVAEGNSMSAIRGMIRLAKGGECSAQQSWDALFNMPT